MAEVIMNSALRTLNLRRFTGLACMAAMLFALASSSIAQVPRRQLDFGPTSMSSGEEPGIIAILIGLLLPAVKEGDRAVAQLSVMTAEGEVNIPVAAGTSRKAVDFRCFMTRDPEKRTLLLNVENTKTKRLYQVPTKSTSVGIRLSFDDSLDVMASATARGFDRMVLGDGSVQPIPVMLLLPAVQKVRG
jgi:hypothetical protein